jgi:hypothetical protein
MNSPRHPIHRWPLAIIVVLGLSLPGCCRWNWRGNGYHDASAHWAENLRPTTTKGQAGLDQRAVDIERNLGYR